MNRRIGQWIRLLLTPGKASAKENQGVTFLLSFLIAVVLWLIVTINLTYKTTLEYTVGLPDNVKLQNNINPTVRIDVEGPGLELFFQHLKLSRDTLKINFSDREIREKNIRIADHQELIVQALPDLSILRMYPEYIYFDYENEVSKVVPLVFRANIQLEPTFQLDFPVSVPIDSVQIVGRPGMVDSIPRWFTKDITTELIQEPTILTIPLVDTVEGIRVYPREVQVEINPVKYTQIQLDVPIQITDIPDGVEVRLSHKSIRYTCLIPQNQYHSVEARKGNFLLEIPFTSLDVHVPYIIPDPATILPDELKIASRNPVKVSFVIIRKLNYTEA